MTPEEIKKQFEKVTPTQVLALVDALDEMLPKHKQDQLSDIYNMAIRERVAPNNIARRVIACAYDWLAFGN